MTNDSGGKGRASLALAGAMTVATLAVFAAVATSGCSSVAASPAPSAPAAAWGFAAPWDPRSDASIRTNGRQLDAIITGFISLDSLTGLPARQYPDDPAQASAQRFALVTTRQGTRTHPEVVRRIAVDDRAAIESAGRIDVLLAQGSYAGVVFDLEGQSREDIPRTLRLIRAVATSARRRGAMTVVVAVPAEDTVAYPTRAYMGDADLVLVKLYDEHWSTSGPGPIASPEWVRRMLGRRVADVGSDRLVAALPMYGYLWRGNQRAAEMLSFNDTRHVTAEANVELARDPTSLSLHAVQPGSWEVWASDAEQFFALRGVAASLGVRRVALWRLGLEDPAIWKTGLSSPY